MTRTAVYDEGQLLCERCGYALTGLPDGAACPECGRDASLSSPALRHLPAWENPEDPRPEILRFLLTTLHVTFRPAHFFRHLLTRTDSRRAYTFAAVHWVLASLLIGAAVFLHLKWFTDFTLAAAPRTSYTLLYASLLVAIVFFAFELTTSLAARLTHWEATYRGLRMPLAVVLRCMHYHAAHYVPVGLVVLATVLAFHHLLSQGTLTALSLPGYLYVLCGQVVLSAVYLFKTYWTSMRNIMYANA